MEKSLLTKEREGKREGCCLSITTWGWGHGEFVQEAKRIGYLAGPMVAVNLSQYFLQIISIMMVGHLSQLSLSSTAIAISLAAVSGFSPLVSPFIYLYVVLLFISIYDFFPLFLHFFIIYFQGFSFFGYKFWLKKMDEIFEPIDTIGFEIDYSLLSS